MNTAELIGYLLVFALSVFWSSFAVNRRSAIFSFLSWITWHTLAMLQLYVGAGNVLAGLEWMFWGLGMFFFVLGLAWTLQNFLIAKKRKEFEIL
jgi:hypothetical protein